MKILHILKMGIGNVVESIPLYLNLREKYGEENIDVRYMKEHGTDDIKNTCFFPARVENITQDIVRYYFGRFNTDNHKIYDWIISDTSLLHPNGDYDRKYYDSMRESDSEIERKLKISKRLGAGTEMLKEMDTSCAPFMCTWEPYILLHNGGLNIPGWEQKKYPYFPQLVEEIRKHTNMNIVCVGSKEEYIDGCYDFTGRELNRTCEAIQNSSFYIGTDTGTAHLAGLMDIPGIILYTKTGMSKNYDKRFHKTLTPISNDCECRPCQRGWHWMPKKCEDIPAPCQEIPVDKIVDLMKEKTNV